MKLLIILVPFALASTALAALFQSGDLGIFEPILKAISELPLVAGMAWILMRQQDRHQEMVDRLIAHFSARSEQKDEMYQTTLEKCLETINSLATK